MPNYTLNDVQNMFKSGPSYPDVSSSDAALIGTGREMNKIYEGAKNLFYRATGNKQALQDQALNQAQDDAIYQKLQDQHPLATMGGEILPYMLLPTGGAATGVGSLVSKFAPKIGQKLATSAILDSALTGAVTGGLRYGDETTAKGGALGGAIGGAVSRVLRPSPGALPQAQQDLVNKFQGMGGRLTPGERTGSTALQKVEAGMDTLGLLGGIKKSNQSLANRVAANAIGENVPELTSDVLDSASARIGQMFEIPTQGKVIDVTTLPGKIDNIASDYAMTGGNDKIVSTLGRIKDAVSNGNISGEDYQSLTSRIGKGIRSAFRGENKDPDLGDALARVKNLLDDTASKVMNPDEQKMFSDARSQYRNLLNLMRPGVLNEQTGNVSSRSLANVLTRTDKTGFRLGKNQSDLYNVARAGKAFRPIVNDSGTATRMLPYMLPLIAGGGAAATNSLNQIGNINNSQAYETADEPSNIPRWMAYGALPLLGSKAYLATPRIAANPMLSSLIQRASYPMALEGDKIMGLLGQ